MYSRTLVAFSLALLGGLTSCGDDSADPTPAPTKTALLTAKSWKLTANQTVVITGGTTVTNDDYADLEACEKDDLTKFNADKSITHDQGATKCADTSSDPQSEKDGTWDFNSDETKLTFTDGLLGITTEVVELSATTLKLKLSDTDEEDGVKYTYTQTMTYTAQ